MASLIAIIILAIGFDFINGFHDSANSIATVVSTKVLKPFIAVVWAAFFNFVAFFAAEYLLGFNIANTVQKVVEEEMVTLPIIIAGLSAAIVWSLITWWKGIPSSSSHTLIGGLIGVAFGILGVFILPKITSITAVLSTFYVLLPFSFSGIVGLIFGFFPAYKASLLNPINALRYE